MNGRGIKFWDFMREVNLIINQLIKLQLLVPTNTTLNNRQLLNLYHVPPKILGPYNENMTFHRLVRHKIENIVVIEIHPSSPRLPPLAPSPWLGSILLQYLRPKSWVRCCMYIAHKTLMLYRFYTSGDRLPSVKYSTNTHMYKVSMRTRSSGETGATEWKNLRPVLCLLYAYLVATRIAQSLCIYVYVASPTLKVTLTDIAPFH